MTASVLLAIAHPLLRRSLQELIESLGTIKVVKAVDSGLATFEAAR